MNVSIWLCTNYFQWCTEQSITLLVWGKSYQDPTMLAIDCLSSNWWYSVQNTNLWWKTLMLWSCGWSATSSWWVVACSWLALLLLVQLLVACPAPPEWLLVLSLLRLLLVACPSPPGMVLSFRLLYGFAEYGSNEFVVLWKNYGVLCTGLVLLGCELLALAELIFTSCWLSWAVVVLSAAPSQSYDWAACVLLAYVLIWSISGRAVKWFGTQVLCTPVIKRTDTTLGIWTQWWKWHEFCQNLRVTKSNPNSVSIWALFVLQVITLRSKWSHWRLIR
jgi:hypothetical protein